MTFGVLWGSAVAIGVGFLAGRLLGLLTAKQGTVWEICGLLLGVFIARNWIPHSNSYLVPIAYVYVPLLAGLICAMTLSPKRTPLGLRTGGTTSTFAG